MFYILIVLPLEDTV
jgi:aldose sugar dehydrogenase